MSSFRLNRKITNSGNLLIVLNLGDFQREFSLYYFGAVDDSGGEFEDLIELFERWGLNLDELKDDSSLFLPFDFSDQCIGGFKATRNDKEVLLSFGWLLREGWKYRPKDLTELVQLTSEFKPHQNVFETSIEIEKLKKEITAQLPLLSAQLREPKYP